MNKLRAGLAQSSTAIFAGILIFAGLYMTSLYSYPLFHTLAEFFSIIIAYAIFLIAWNTQRYFDNHYLLFIGIAYQFIGILDLAHTFAYKGMTIFPAYDTNLPTQLWIIARYSQSAILLIAPFFVTRKINVRWVLIGCASLTTVLLALAFTRIFPVSFVEGVGLTPFKIVSEYIISAILVGALIHLTTQRARFDPRVFRLIAASIVLTIGSELAFTFYVGVYDFSNQAGHWLKIVAFFLIYKVIVETGLKKPFDLLFRSLKQNETALKRERDFTTSVLNTTHALIVTLDPAGRIVQFNSACETITGFAFDQAKGQIVWEFLVPPTEQAEARALFERVVQSQVSCHSENHWQTRVGALRRIAWAHTPVLDETGHIEHVIATGTDVTETRQAEDKLRYLSSHDALTGLYNRFYFEEELARLERGREFPISLIMVDLDRLKETNDSYGHAAGDELIKRAATILLDAFRGEDIVARIGGDEFAVILPRTDEPKVNAVMARIRERSAAQNGSAVSFSIGASTALLHESLFDALKRADARMYEEKATRRAREQSQSGNGR